MAKKVETETETTDVEAVSDPKFNKQQIIRSNRYQNWRDLLSVILKDDRQYTHDEISKEIDEFMTKGQVN